MCRPSCGRKIWEECCLPSQAEVATAVVVENAVLKNVSTDQGMDSLREQLGGHYRNAVDYERTIFLASRGNDNSNIVFDGGVAFRAGRWRHYVRKPPFVQLQMTQNFWVQATSICACV